jgi:hypothetical protein
MEHYQVPDHLEKKLTDTFFATKKELLQIFGMNRLSSGIDLITDCLVFLGRNWYGSTDSFSALSAIDTNKKSVYREAYESFLEDTRMIEFACSRNYHTKNYRFEDLPDVRLLCIRIRTMLATMQRVLIDEHSRLVHTKKYGLSDVVEVCIHLTKCAAFIATLQDTSA